MALEVNGLHKSFTTKAGTQHVLRGVDLTVRAGEFVSIIGHSGCGKSTLLNVIAGLERPDGGSVLLDGDVVREPGPDRAMVFQNFSLLPGMTLHDNVRTAVAQSRPEWTTGQIAADSERYLRSFGLWEHRKKRPGQVSGGMKQRAAVARAFAVQPRVLLLDEPFGALDALTRAALQDELIGLWAGESETEIVVMVTHGIEEALYLADRIVVMGNPPGSSIVDVIAVPLPRPRERAAMVDDPLYRQAHERLMRTLHLERAA